MKIFFSVDFRIKLIILFTGLLYLCGSVLIFRDSEPILILRSWLPVSFGVFVFVNFFFAFIYYSLQVSLIAFSEMKSVKIIAWFNLFLAVTLMASNIIMNFVEQAHYANYVYGVLGVYLIYLRQFAMLQLPTLMISVIILGRKYFALTEKSIQGIIQALPLLLLTGVLGLILLSNLNTFPSWLIPAIKQALINSQISASERFEIGMEHFHTQAKFIAAHTPEDAVIVHPQQSATFPIIGNQVMMRYYLYPRTLVSENKLSDFILDNPETTTMYSIFAKGLENDNLVVFPNEMIESESIIILMDDHEIQRFENQIITEDWLKSHKTAAIGVLKYNL